MIKQEHIELMVVVKSGRSTCHNVISFDGKCKELLNITISVETFTQIETGREANSHTFSQNLQSAQ